MKSSTTDTVRVWNMVLWTLAVLATLLGWMLGRDPAGLAVLLPALTAVVGVGEASNVGKRATFKPEVHSGGS